jgi:hypothetical protein
VGMTLARKKAATKQAAAAKGVDEDEQRRG